MLAVAETEQVSAPSAGTKGEAHPGQTRPAAPLAAAPVQRCAVAGCGCGGTCGGHGARPPAAGADWREERAWTARRTGPLPLDGVLARAVQARAATASGGVDVLAATPSVGAAGGVLARSSSSSGGSGSGSSRSASSQSSASGGAGGGAGAGGGSGTCKVDVRATHIGGILSSLPLWHLFVVTTDAGGTERYYRGGPGGPGGGPTYGSIRTNDGLYVPGTVDWAPGAPSKTVVSGAGACGKDACLTAELRRIDATRTAYAPTGPNSNTVAATILGNCGIPKGKPVWIAPGWSDPAI